MDGKSFGKMEAITYNNAIILTRGKYVVKILVSSCLLGLNCRYSGDSCFSLSVAGLAQNHTLIPVCPEQMGGLTTPREPAQIIDGNGVDIWNGRATVINASGKDVTPEFIRGARKALNFIKQYKVTEIVLKERSPSCAVHFIYRGNSIVNGMGVTCALFLHEGFKVLSDEDINNIHV